MCLGLGLSFGVVLVLDLLFGPRPLDQRLRRAEQEHQLGEQVFFERKLAGLAHQVDVVAELQDAVHVRHVVEHDLEADLREEAPQEPRGHENERRVQTDYAAESPQLVRFQI